MFIEMNLSQLVYGSKFLSWIYCKVSQLRYPGYKNEVERRAQLDLFDYKDIAMPLPKCYYELCNDNNCFGIGWSIRQYIGSRKHYINALVEHGYFFGKYVQDKEKKIFVNKLLTFSDIRKKHIEDVVVGKKIIPIGPYIHYAPLYYDEERLFREKEKLGRTLLVFFSHSGTGVSVSFDLDALIGEINRIRCGFKTVVISLFWSDIKPEIERRLIEEGYKIFCSGHRYDYYFLSRQKTMIKLADMTMSNSIGTHIAYCTYLNKPHWIIRQEINKRALTGKGAANIAIENKIRQDPVAVDEMEEFYQSFSFFSEKLSEKQKELCNKIFGFSYIRSADKMKELLG